MKVEESKKQAADLQEISSLLFLVVISDIAGASPLTSSKLSS